MSWFYKQRFNTKPAAFDEWIFNELKTKRWIKFREFSPSWQIENWASDMKTKQINIHWPWFYRQSFKQQKVLAAFIAAISSDEFESGGNIDPETVDCLTTSEA